MAYIKKEFRRLLQLCDEQFTIPKSFEKFRADVEQTHNLIIKSKKGHCLCTNCQQEFTCYKKVNTETKCPSCRKKLLIKTDRLQCYMMKDCLQLIDRIEDKYVIRTFELYSFYNNNKVRHMCTEFMRTILIDNEEHDFVSDVTHNKFGYIYIGHRQKHQHWRSRDTRWAYRDIHGMVCPYNLKSLFKGTVYQYSQLDKFVKHSGYTDIAYFLKVIPNHPRFEYLVKLKLYNLASEVSKFDSVINNKFEDVFRVNKEFYPFMKKHDITYNQLRVLQLAKKADIRLLKGLQDCYNLEWLSKVVNLEKAWRLGLLNSRNEHEYKDYLEFCIQLGYDMKDKNVLYPKNLTKSHDKLEKLVEICENEANSRLLKERYELLKEKIYQNKKYLIYPASSADELIEESKQQSNCVKTYCKKAAFGECDIYLMRLCENPERSLVTVEVRDDKVVQARVKHNNECTKEQWKFLHNWEERILNRKELVNANV